VAQTLRGEGFDASEDGTGRQNLVPIGIGRNISEENLDKVLGFQSKASHTNSMNPDIIAPTLDVGKSDGLAVCGAFKGGQGSKAGGIGYDTALSPTLGAADSGSNRTPTAHIGMAVRRLTPVECEKLQGFPPGYTNIPDAKGKPAADGPRYKSLGNSWAVPNVAWIGKRIQIVDDILRGKA
jgi:DNA (cytosine-5)-methyltransferase 1